MGALAGPSCCDMLGISTLHHIAKMFTILLQQGAPCFLLYDSCCCFLLVCNHHSSHNLFAYKQEITIIFGWAASHLRHRENDKIYLNQHGTFTCW